VRKGGQFKDKGPAQAAAHSIRHPMLSAAAPATTTSGAA
jgi:hypothetical protein